MTQKQWIAILLLLLSIGGAYVWYSQQVDPIAENKASEEDITREQTEAHMRQIGYVQ